MLVTRTRQARGVSTPCDDRGSFRANAKWLIEGVHNISVSSRDMTETVQGTSAQKNPAGHLMLFALCLGVSSKVAPLVVPGGEFVDLNVAEVVAWLGQPLSYGIGLMYLWALWPLSWWCFRMRSLQEAAIGGALVGSSIAFCVYPYDATTRCGATAHCGGPDAIGLPEGIWVPLLLLLLTRCIYILAYSAWRAIVR